MDEQTRSATVINILLSILEQDRKHVMLYVGGCFAVPTFTLGHLQPLRHHTLAEVVLAMSLAGFVSAGTCFFLYAQRLHWKRLEVIQDVIDLDAVRLRARIFGGERRSHEPGVWKTAGTLFEAGQNILLLAALGYVVFFIINIFDQT